MIALDGARQHDVGLGDLTGRGPDDIDAHALHVQPLHACLHGLCASLNICLDDDVDVLHIALLDLTGQIVQRHGAGGIAFLLHPLLQSCLCDMTGLLVIVERLEHIAGDRDIVEADDLHRRGRQRLFDLTPAVIHHLAHTAVCRTDDQRVSGTQRSGLHQQRGYRVRVPCPAWPR